MRGTSLWKDRFGREIDPFFGEHEDRRRQGIISSCTVAVWNLLTEVKLQCQLWGNTIIHVWSWYTWSRTNKRSVQKKKKRYCLVPADKWSRDYLEQLALYHMTEFLSSVQFLICPTRTTNFNMRLQRWTLHLPLETVLTESPWKFLTVCGLSPPCFKPRRGFCDKNCKVCSGFPG